MKNLARMQGCSYSHRFDEDNLLLALTANRHNIKHVIAKVSRTSYAEIITDMGIDMALNHLDITTREVIRFVQGYSKVLSSQIIQGQAEIMEFIASPRTKILNKPLKELELPAGVLIAAVHKGSKVIIPNGNTVIDENDRVTMICMLSELGIAGAIDIEESERRRLAFFRKRRGRAADCCP